ncbi:MAG: plastocyanin/azurin family copper-binding protein [Ilumatobacter sp.]|uniref:cupredoxin domain-containing protein n=1 Tax=Ilumatobacter sp. TaxID=1967498 RepID=UPI003297C2BC
MRRVALLGAALALVGASCAPDPLDTYAAPDADAPPATRAPLPTTTAASEPVGQTSAAPDDTVPAPDRTFEPNGDTAEVRSLDNSFVQQDLTIEAGTEVEWVNGGRNDHDIIPVDPTLTWGIDRDTFVPGAEYAHVFVTPGVFPYYCSIHGTSDAGMIGAIIVTEPT